MDISIIPRLTTTMISMCCPPSRWSIEEKRNFEIKGFNGCHAQLPVKNQFLGHDIVDNPKSVNKEKLISESLFDIMELPENRLDSFNGKWPLPFINIKDLVESGFFYLQSDDKVQCAFCELILRNWQNGDRPLKEHIKNSPNCPFLTSSGSVSLLHKQKSLISSNYCNESLPLSAGRKPKVPRMTDFHSRLFTYKAWPLSAIDPTDLADCGLYYTGVGDIVSCFFCGGSLGNWKPFDDPMVEHSKYYPSCMYLRLLKSHPNQRKRNSRKQSDIVKQNSPSSVRQCLSEDMFESKVVQQAKEIFPASVVENLVRENFKQTGQTFTSLPQLCERLLDYEEKKMAKRVTPSIKSDKASSQPEVTIATGAAGLSYANDRLTCVICMDRERGIMFLPCHHTVACEKCAELISECPLCRKLIDTRVKTYLS